ncbi:MAG TPA: DUF1641 domain-containing protein [Azospirillum sp.]|nr:DUF1641 domain-containing protein [Azospirillum sp.]
MADTMILDRTAAPASPSSLDALLRAAGDAITDGMVERAATTGANALEVLDRLNDEDTRAAILALTDGLTRLHRSGALETAINLLSMLHAMREAATDGMIERLVVFVETMISNLATEQIALLAKATEYAMEDAVADVQKVPEPTMFGILRELRKPETLRTLSFLLAFGRRVHERSEQWAHKPPVS